MGSNLVPNFCMGEEEGKGGDAGRFSLILCRISLILCRIFFDFRQNFAIFSKNLLTTALQHAKIIQEKLLWIP